MVVACGGGGVGGALLTPTRGDMGRRGECGSPTPGAGDMGGVGPTMALKLASRSRPPGVGGLEARLDALLLLASDTRLGGRLLARVRPRLLRLLRDICHFHIGLGSNAAAAVAAAAAGVPGGDGCGGRGRGGTCAGADTAELAIAPAGDGLG